MDFDPVIAVSGIASMIAGYLAFQETGAGTAVWVFFVSFLALTLTLKTGPLSLLDNLTNPFVMFFAVLAASFVYFSIQGNTFWPATAKSLGTAFLGGAVSMTIFNYWNIGG